MSRAARLFVGPTHAPALELVSIRDSAVIRGASGSVRKVIVSHPSESYAATLERELIAAGLAVTRCKSAKCLRREVAQEAVDLLITELRMPDGPVLDVIVALRAQRPDVRIVVTTAHDSVATAVRCFRVGVHGYFTGEVPAADILREVSAPSAPSAPSVRASPLRLERAVWEYLNRVVEHAGSITRAAEVLNLDRRSLRRMLGKYAPPP